MESKIPTKSSLFSATITQEKPIFDTKSEARKKEFRNEINENDFKRKREEQTEQYRKKNREHLFSRKRTIDPNLLPESPLTANIDFKVFFPKMSIKR